MILIMMVLENLKVKPKINPLKNKIQINKAKKTILTITLKMQKN